jgi:hypothetical protein
VLSCRHPVRWTLPAPLNLATFTFKLVLVPALNIDPIWSSRFRQPAAVRLRKTNITANTNCDVSSAEDTHRTAFQKCMELYILSISHCWDLHISVWQCLLLVYLDLLASCSEPFYYASATRRRLSVRYYSPTASCLLLRTTERCRAQGRQGKPFGALPVQRLLGSTLTFPFLFDYHSFHPTLACPRGQCCLALFSKDFPPFSLSYLQEKCI